MSVATSWSCQRCTLINGINDIRCRVCQFECPFANGRSGVFNKFKLPHFSLTSAVEALDSAIDMVAKTISPRNEQNVHFLPTSTSVSEFQQPTRSYPNCTQLDYPTVNCVAEDATSSYWICSKCDLHQPFPPLNLKCLLCKTKTTLLKTALSKSMPHIGHPENNLAEDSPNFGFIEEKEIESHTSVYNDIMQFCRNNHQFFVDDSFPHSLRSIGPLSQLEQKNLKITWLRPEQIFTRDGQLSRWSVFNDPQPTDIEQGLLGNCWFLSALAVVSERPDILEKLFLTKEYNHSGVYEMRLCIDGIWQHIFVDDFLPCHKRNRSMIFAVGRKNQLWVSLIEKALAKVYGNYAILRAGRTVEGLSTLTGSPTISIDLEYMNLEPESRNAALDIAWAKLISAREARFLMGCSCGAGKRVANEDEYRRVGLMSQHAYSLLDVRQTSQGHRLVHLRNPWGTFVWLGEFSKTWSGWTPQLRRELSDIAAWPGTFWMPFEKFAFYFDTVDIAQLREHNGWTAKRYLVDIGWEEHKTKAIRLIVTEPTELCAILFQRNARTSLDQVDIMLMLHKQEKDSIPGELICRSSRKIQPIVRTDDTFLHSGEYLLVAQSFSKFGDRLVPGTIAIHSSKNVFTEVLPISLDNLQRSMCALMLKEGTIQKSCTGTVSRYLTNEFAGLALMVDNNNHNCCVQVHSGCQNSTNVLSTRSSLLAIDSIPPLHRQIVTLLTHFEPSQSFMVGHRLIHRPTSFPHLRDFAPDPKFGKSQNYPLLLQGPIESLHGPRPIYH